MNEEYILKASLLYKSNCTLGEGATWHSGRNSFFWVDIEGKMIYEYDWPLQKINTMECITSYQPYSGN